MPKPKNWRQINAIREAFWKEMFDDVNESFDAVSEETLNFVDKKRRELQNLLLKKAHLYRTDKDASAFKETTR